MSELKLGRLSSPKDRVTLKFNKYKTIPVVVPATIDHYSKIGDWLMFMNDTVGCCTIAALGHLIREWTNGNAVITDDQIIQAYSDNSGYNPATGDNDNGCDMLTVQKYAMSKGIAGHKNSAFAELDATRLQEILEGLFLFEGVDIGVNLPQSAMDQFNANLPWTVSGDSTILGGHSICIVGFDGTWFYVVTWRKLVQVSPQWLSVYMDEAYVEISEDYFNGNKSIEGYDFDTLKADLIAISDGTYDVPPVDPTPIPIPSPTPIPVPDNETILQKIIEWVEKELDIKESDNLKERTAQCENKVKILDSLKSILDKYNYI
jgi:hypothetical protein